MDVDDLAHLITTLLKRARPSIDEDLTFELLLELLTEHEEINDDILAHYSDAINHSADPGPKVTH